MTPEQIEVAARKLCELRRRAPEYCRLSYGGQPSPYDAIRALAEAQEAIKYALEQK